MHGNDEIKSILVANKCDQESKRQVSREEGMEFAKRHGLLYIETSAKSGKNVEELFTTLAQEVFRSLNLGRDISQYSDADIKKLESHGVKVGPRKPLVMVGPPTATSSCC
ncbi:Ras- protein Rab-2-B [Kappamyces sp. JEL0829]|nr:Ras- protein Rab-2-B [Kappamyces sp. JEL0829]